MSLKVHYPTPCFDRLHGAFCGPRRDESDKSQYKASPEELARRAQSHHIAAALEAEENLRFRLEELDYTMPNFLAEALAYLRAELKSMGD